MTRRERWDRLKNLDAGMPSFIALFPNEANSELYFITVIEGHDNGDVMLDNLEEWHRNWVESRNRHDLAIREKEGWDNLRKIRNDVLLRTDWSQVSDAPITSETRALYRQYRKYLRDLPTTASRVDEILMMSFSEFIAKL